MRQIGKPHSKPHCPLNILNQLHFLCCVFKVKWNQTRTVYSFFFLSCSFTSSCQKSQISLMQIYNIEADKWSQSAACNYFLKLCYVWTLNRSGALCSQLTANSDCLLSFVWQVLLKNSCLLVLILKRNLRQLLEWVLFSKNYALK